MRVGVTRETAAGERRVALVPDSVGRLAQSGISVVVEPGAGVEAAYADEVYRDAGAELGPAWDADAVVKVQAPAADEVERCATARC